MIRAAGILIVNKEGNALFLKRAEQGDYPGTWCFPGGRVEEGEDALAAAVRETMEECGFRAKSPTYLTRRVMTVDRTVPTIAQPALSLGDVLAANATAPVIQEVSPLGEQVDYTTFYVKGVDEFTPILNSEHVGYAWAPIDQPPAPLHPGCSIALRRAKGMNELEVAQAIRDGDLTSPQDMGSFSMFAIRITGTEYAYRSRNLGETATKKDIAQGKKVDAVSGKLIAREAEYVYRDPAFYLNDEFLARCNGLPVVLEHPEGMQVNSEEYNDRSIGTVFLPYILGSEVWSIAKIYDAKAAAIMRDTQVSTSPGVVWHEAPGIMSEVDGHKFLIEGKPHLLDHIAICWQGVWDKGGEPVGVTSTRGDSDMTAEELKKALDEKNLADAARNETIDKVLLGLSEGMTAIKDSVAKFTGRMDADDEKKKEDARADARKDAEGFKFGERKDGESDEDFKDRRDAETSALCDAFEAAGEDKDEAKKKADSARKDADDEDEKKKNDSARKDSDARTQAALGLGTDLKKQLEDIQKKLGTITAAPDADIASYGKVQARADAAYSAMGGSAPRPAPGESLLDYRKRLVIDLKPHSKTWAKAEISVAAVDEAIFGTIETQVISEALATASDPAKVPTGKLQPIHSRLDSGHNQTKWLGRPGAWMRAFSHPLQAGSFVGNKPANR